MKSVKKVLKSLVSLFNEEDLGMIDVEKDFKTLVEGDVSFHLKNPPKRILDNYKDFYSWEVRYRVGYLLKARILEFAVAYVLEHKEKFSASLEDLEYLLNDMLTKRQIIFWINGLTFIHNIESLEIDNRLYYRVNNVSEILARDNTPEGMVAWVLRNKKLEARFKDNVKKR